MYENEVYGFLTGVGTRGAAAPKKF